MLWEGLWEGEGYGRALGGLWEDLGSSGVICDFKPRIAIPLTLNAKVAFSFILRIVFEAPITKYCKLQ